MLPHNLPMPAHCFSSSHISHPSQSRHAHLARAVPRISLDQANVPKPQRQNLLTYPIELRQRKTPRLSPAPKSKEQVFKRPLKTLPSQMSLSELTGLLAKLLVFWFLAGLISSALSLTYVGLTGGLADTMGAVAIEIVLARLPFPFDLIAGVSIDPFSILLQFLFFVVLVFLFEVRGSGST